MIRLASTALWGLRFDAGAVVPKSVDVLRSYLGHEVCEKLDDAVNVHSSLGKAVAVAAAEPLPMLSGTSQSLAASSTQVNVVLACSACRAGWLVTASHPIPRVCDLAFPSSRLNLIILPESNPVSKCGFRWEALVDPRTSMLNSNQGVCPTQCANSTES
jgi:hypothetical protein